MTFRFSYPYLALCALALAAFTGLFASAISVRAQNEGQMLCGYLGGIYGPGIIISGTIPPCPTAHEAFTNPEYGGNSQCAYPGNLLPVCSQDKWFWVDIDDTNPPDPEDPPDPEPGDDVTATLTANPETIEDGDESVLTWSSTNATSCVGTGFSTGGATEGSVPVFPSETTNYIVTCTDGTNVGSDGTWSLEYADDISDIHCPSGSFKSGNANDTNVYSGIPTCSSSNPTGSACGNVGGQCKYNTWYAPGDPLNCWIVTDLYTCDTTTASPDSHIHTASDSVLVTVTDATNELSATCSVAPETIEQGDSAIWTASATGGNGTYAYQWSGTDGLSGITASVAKQYVMPGEKVAQVEVTSDGQIVTVACNNSLTVTAASLPNLQASNVTHTPAEPESGQAVTLRATIRNVLSNPTVTGFEDQFQINKDFVPLVESDIDDTVQFGSGALAGNSSNIASTLYYFPSDGVWYVRACADRTEDGSAPYDVLETVESDNCGNDWTRIDVGEPPGDITCDYDYDDTDADGRVDIGEDVHFSASPGNLGSSAYTWDPSDGPAVSGEGSEFDYEFDTNGTFNMRVSADGHGSDVCSVSVVPPGCVGAECDCVAQELSLTASPSRVARNDTAILTYEIPGVEDGITSCTIRSNKDTSFVRTITIDSCSVEESGTVTTHSITTQTIFTLTCDTETATAQVDVLPDIIEI
ncbi:MAG: hypothetical protein KBC38_03425 [Candidatus Pacebacteria bacterium]|nr:hypothetical protein [Candidatus Paceibacterota bacterium]MBP9840773.1 hypothetical protein [Candidatus Paceibacterota bacterium]